MTTIRTLAASDMQVGNRYRVGEAAQSEHVRSRDDFTLLGYDCDDDGIVTALIDLGEGTLTINLDADDAVTEQVPFEAGYPQSETRIYRKGLHADDGGVATVTFRGDIADATQMFTGTSRNGTLSVFAEVTPTETTATRLTFAVVPTGKRIPTDGTRLGTERGRSVYLLTVDGTVDRAEYDAERATQRAERVAERAQAEADAAEAARIHTVGGSEFRGTMVAHYDFGSPTPATDPSTGSPWVADADLDVVPNGDDGL